MKKTMLFSFLIATCVTFASVNALAKNKGKHSKSTGYDKASAYMKENKSKKHGPSHVTELPKKKNFAENKTNKTNKAKRQIASSNTKSKLAKSKSHKNNKTVAKKHSKKSKHKG